MNELIAPFVGITLGIGGGLVLYSRFSGASATFVALSGIVRNVFIGLSGLFLIVGGGWFGVLFGGPLLMFSIFLGSGHAENLSGDESVRKWLSG